MDVDEAGVFGNGLDRAIDIVETIRANANEPPSAAGERNSILGRQRPGQSGFVQDDDPGALGRIDFRKLFGELFDRHRPFKCRAQFPPIVEKPLGRNGKQCGGQGGGHPRGGRRRTPARHATDVDRVQDEHRDEEDQASPFGEPEQTGDREPVFGGRPGERECVAQATVRHEAENEFGNDAENNGDLGGATDGRSKVFHDGALSWLAVSGRSARAGAFAPDIAAFAFFFIRGRPGGVFGGVACVDGA